MIFNIVRFDILVLNKRCRSSNQLYLWYYWGTPPGTCWI